MIPFLFAILFVNKSMKIISTWRYIVTDLPSEEFNISRTIIKKYSEGYPSMALFDKITRAAKGGNKELVICYNPWIFPRLTEFQDYYAGEVGLSVESSGRENPYLPEGGSGVFTDGPQRGLQATYTGVLEPGEWTHIYKDTDIPAPLFTAGELVRIISESNRRKNLPMMNIRVYQDGSISAQTYKLLKDVKHALIVGE